MHDTRNLGPAVKTEVTAEYQGLRHARITEHGNEARVFTAGLTDLTAWYLALGGHITREGAPAGSGVCLWTLHTTSDDVPVLVQSLALDSDPIDPNIADAVRLTPPGATP